MKKNKTIIVAAVLMSFLSCNSNKENTKDIALHEHSNFKETNNVVDYFGAYTLEDKKYGTKTVVTLKGDKRIIVSNALPNHEVGDFPNSGNPNTIRAQQIKHEIPLNPVYIGQSRWAREVGVALNGIKFEPETNERIECNTGEVYRIEAKQKLVDMGLDFNNAHVQPTGAYHYHAAPLGVIKAFDKGEDLVHIGFAHDGFAIYYSKSSKYKPSFQLASKDRTGVDCTYNRPGFGKQSDYEGTKKDGTFVQDWEYIEGLGDLDKCNGIKINDTYMYIITDEYPYVGRCLNGEFTEEHPHGPPPPGGGHGQRRHGPPR